MIRRPPRSTRVRSSAASDVYKRQKVWDSGARRHVVRDRNRLKPGTERACPFRIRGINSGGSQPLCMGDAEEYVPLNDGSVVTVPLMGAVFMPEAPHDIISPGILEKDGFCSWDGKLPDGRSVVLENHRFILMPACKPRQKTHTLASKEQSILVGEENTTNETCLLYTSPSPRDRQKSRMPSSA